MERCKNLAGLGRAGVSRDMETYVDGLGAGASAFVVVVFGNDVYGFFDVAQDEVAVGVVRLSSSK